MFPGEGNDCSIACPVAGASHSLSYRGLGWAQALLNSAADAVTIECTSSSAPLSVRALVKVEIEIDRPIVCTVRENAVKVWPTASRKVLKRSLRGADQLLALVDTRGQPWADVEIGDQVHLFDPSGRERARVIRAFDQDGSRLALRCWDETGHEIAGTEPLAS